jgi:GntR family transcriptional regulator
MAGYRDIAAQLRQDIERGTYAPGESIPTEPALAGRYGVSRGTVRRALLVLKADGLLRSASKRGTYVTPAPVRLPVARYAAVTDPARPRADLGPWETACADQGITGLSELTSVERSPAGPDLAGRLDLVPDAVVVCRSRRMWADDHLAQIQDAWMPAALIDGTPLAVGSKVIGGVYAAMTAAGLTPATVTEEITARSATSAERDRLALDDPAPGLVVEVWRTTRDLAGRPLEALRIVADARLTTFVYENLPLR